MTDTGPFDAVEFARRQQGDEINPLRMVYSLCQQSELSDEMARALATSLVKETGSYGRGGVLSRLVKPGNSMTKAEISSVLESALPEGEQMSSEFWPMTYDGFTYCCTILDIAQGHQPLADSDMQHVANILTNLQSASDLEHSLYGHDGRTTDLNPMVTPLIQRISEGDRQALHELAIGMELSGPLRE